MKIIVKVGDLQGNAVEPVAEASLDAKKMWRLIKSESGNDLCSLVGYQEGFMKFALTGLTESEIDELGSVIVGRR